MLSVVIDSILKLYDTNKYKIYSDYNKLNIFGIRKATRKNNLNQFQDVLGYFYNSKDGYQFKTFKGTTTPGHYWLGTLMNPKGTAILVPGQYEDTWSIGMHLGKYEALCQRKPVKVYRDKNKDEILDMDPKTIDSGIFGINIHRAHLNTVAYYIGKYSAGCQVIQDPAEFSTLMILAHLHKQLYSNSFTYTLFAV